MASAGQCKQAFNARHGPKPAWHQCKQGKQPLQGMALSLLGINASRANTHCKAWLQACLTSMQAGQTLTARHGSKPAWHQCKQGKHPLQGIASSLLGINASRANTHCKAWPQACLASMQAAQALTARHGSKPAWPSKQCRQKLGNLQSIFCGS